MSKRWMITKAEAMGALPDDDDHQHTMAMNGMFIGADSSRESIECVIDRYGCAFLSGPMAAGMGHGICIDHDRRLMAQTDPVKLAALEEAIKAESVEEGDRIIAELRAGLRERMGWDKKEGAE